MIILGQDFWLETTNGVNSLLTKDYLLAEREGFEPPVRFPVHLISREQSKRDVRIDNHKFTAENNYPLPSLLRISANLCSQFLHNSFTATSAHQLNKLIPYQVRRCKSACELMIFHAVLLLCRFSNHPRLIQIASLES